MDNNLPKLSIVVPCYNEEATLEETTKELTRVMDDLVERKKVSIESIIFYVDDGSSDNTWQIIEEKIDENPYVQGLKLSRNFGHQGALIAGLETAREFSDCVISIDADLQDDVDVIKDFVDKYQEGYEIVYGVRDKRDTDTPFKRNTALWFYSLMEKLGVKLVQNHADYRLMSKTALDEFVKYQEENLFIRGIIPLLGFKTAKVYYNRKERFAGESKYPLKKMIAFALEGITSFSVAPIRVVSILGFLMVLIGIGIGIYTLFSKIFSYTVSGWTSLMLSIWIVGGVQLIALGIIGEYIGKIFKEAKRRPRYTIEHNSYIEKQKVLPFDPIKVK